MKAIFRTVGETCMEVTTKITRTAQDDEVLFVSTEFDTENK